MEAIIEISLKRDDGVIVSRRVVVTSSRYDRAPVAAFKARARRRAIETLNAVLGVRENITITDVELAQKKP